MSRKPRILLVTPDFPPQVGGIQILLQRLLSHAPGLDFRVVTLGTPGDAEYDRAEPWNVHRVATSSMDRRLAGVVLNAVSVAEATRFKPDAILSGHVVASIGAMTVKRALGVPLIQYVHAEEMRSRARLAARAIAAAELTIAVSAHTAAMVEAAGGSRERTRIIHPGVDLPPTVSRRPSLRPTLLTVARMLYRYKGHDVMVRAMPLIRARVPDARWVVIGDGPFEPAVINAVEAYDLGESVELLGRVDDAVRDEWFDRADVFCMPSRVPPGGFGGEGFGIVYMEAAARGMASIGGDVGGARDAVRAGETGLLIDPADHLAVASAATSLLGDRERARQMGVAARAWAEEHAWPRVGAEVESAVHQVLADRRR